MINRICVSLVVFVIAFGNSNCSADLVFTITDNGSGGVLVTGTGSGTTTGGGPGGGTQKWNFEDFGSNFLSGSLGTNSISANTVSGTFTNVTTSSSVSIDDFQVDRDPNSNDDIEVGTSTKLSFSSGDEYTFSLSAEFLSSNLAFADIIQSTHVDSGGGSNNEIFGTVTVVAVPEPSSFLLCSLCALGFLRLRRK